MKNKKADGTAPKHRINYLFSAYYNNNGKREGKVKLLPNVLFAAKTLVPEYTNNKKYSLSEKIIPWHSNHLGAINMVEPDFKDGPRIRMLTEGFGAKEQDLYFPLVSDYAYLYSLTGDDWKKALNTGIPDTDIKGLQTEPRAKYIRQTITFQELEEPLTDKELCKQFMLTREELKLQLQEAKADIRSNNKPEKQHEELIYKAWYQMQKPDDIYHGYIIKQSRFIILTFSTEAVNEQTLIRLWHKKNNKKYNITPSIKTENGLLALVRAPKKELVSGLYHIQVSLDIDTQWSQKTQTDQHYTLTEKLRFDIKTLAGDIAIVNADPISVEETLFKQHPSQFLHLVRDPQTGKTIESGDGSLKSLIHDMKVNKTRMDFVRGVLDFDGQRESFKSLGNTLHQVLMDEGTDQSIRRNTQLAFNILDYQYGTFNQLKQTARQLKSLQNESQSLGTLLQGSHSIIKELWKKPVEQEQQNTAQWLFSRFNLPDTYIKTTLDKLGLLSRYGDNALNIFELTRSAQQFFYADIQNQSLKNQQCHEVFDDYHRQIGQIDDASVEPETQDQTFKPGQWGELNFSLHFAENQFDIAPERAVLSRRQSESPAVQENSDTKPEESTPALRHSTEQRTGTDALNELLQFLQQHPEVNILIKGFADPVGRTEENILAAIGGDIEALYLRHIENYSLYMNNSGLAAQNDNIKDWYNAA